MKPKHRQIRGSLSALPASLFLLIGLLMAGCGGSKVLKETEPLVVTKSIATASDQHLSTTLDFVVVRNGPGTWAKNVAWDEYLMRVQNLADDSIRVTNITVLGSLGTRIEPRENRSQLVKGTNKTKRRYKGEGLKVKAGANAVTLWAAVDTTLEVGLLYGTILSTTVVTTTQAAAVTGLILVPALAVGGVIKGMNNSKVNKRVESRQTLLPIVLQEEEEKSLDIFFPLAPSPRQVEIAYTDFQGDHTLNIDTRTALDQLHLWSQPLIREATEGASK